MRKLISIYRSNDKEVRLFQSTNKVRAEVYSIKPFKKISHYDRLCLDVRTFLKLNGEKRMLEYVGITNVFKVPFKYENNKLVLFPVNKQRRVIWTNDDYDEWLKCMIADMEEGETEEDFDYDRYNEDCSLFLDDERVNLNVEVEGYIVAFASLGLWNGRVNGAKLIGTNVRSILYSDCDYVTWYCDRYNVRCDAIHHDGTNHIIYRVAKSKEDAERLQNLIAYHDMTEEEFRKRTRSLRPYVANVYGW